MGIVAPPFSPMARGVPDWKQAGVWVPIGFRGRGVPGGSQTYDASVTALMEQQAFRAPSWCGVSAIRPIYAGFDMDTIGEVDRPNTATITAAARSEPTTTFTAKPTQAYAAGVTQISLNTNETAGIHKGMSASGVGTANVYVTNVAPTYDASNNMTGLTVTLSAATGAALTTSSNITFSGLVVPAMLNGSRSIVVPPHHGFVVGDPVGIPLAADERFYWRNYVTFSPAGARLAGQSSSPSISGEGCLRTGATDTTLGTTTPTHTGGGYWGPVGFLAQIPEPMPSVLGIGDSIMFGSGDGASPDADGRVGFFQRSLGNDIPWLSLARGGMTLGNCRRRFPGMLSILGVASFTDVFIQLVRNDLASSQTAASCLTRLEELAAPFKAAGLRVWVATSPPTTTGTWTSAAGQTTAGSEAQRSSFNSTIRSEYAARGYAGVIDIASVIEDPAAPGKWISTGGIARTDDGIHPNSQGVADIVASGILTPDMFIRLGV